MERFAAPMLALLLVVAGVAAVPLSIGAGVGSAPTSGDRPVDAAVDALGPPEQSPNSSARMVIRSPDRTGRGTVGPSLSTALAQRSESMLAQHESMALGYRFQDMASGDRRANLIIAELIETEERIAALLNRQQRAVSAYAAGSISKGELLRRLAAIDREARLLDRRLETLEELTRRANIDYLDTRLRNATALVSSMQGPVRKRIAAALEAERSLPRVHVEANETAVVLAMIDGGRFVREAFFHDNLQLSGSRQLDRASEATDRVRQYYPWVFERYTNLLQTPWETVYRFQVDHPHGRLDTYLDAHSGDVFRETHNLRLSRLPTHPARSVASGGIRVVLNRTYRGGPMRVDVYDATSGERIEGQVTLGNQTVGRTGSDGAIWFVEPRSSYRVTVTSDGTTVTLNVSSG